MSGGGAGTPNPDSETHAPARVETAAPAPRSPLERLSIPSSLAEHPHAARLVTALATFEFGDYGATRSHLAPVLADAQAPAELRLAAEKLQSAMGFEPGAVAMAAACALFFIVILWLVY
jgi:hypothetical protein